jgi:hypothetical protein
LTTRERRRLYSEETSPQKTRQIDNKSRTKMLALLPHRVAKFVVVLLALVPSGQAFALGRPISAASPSMTTTTSRSAVAAPTPDVKTPAVATSTARPRHSSKQQQLNRLNLRSPFISLEIKPATRLEELLAVIDLRAEVFANPALPLKIESKLRHIKHLLTRRAKGSVVLVASARDLLSPFSEVPSRTTQRTSAS